MTVSSPAGTPQSSGTDSTSRVPASPFGGTPDEQKKRDLRKMKALALSFLIGAAIVYLFCEYLDTKGSDLSIAGPWVGYVKAAAEAGMVGGLADWFAVTALFRHPLGLPIPHTAIIKRKKDQLGASLEDFVTENFLTEENVRTRLDSAQVPRRLGVWLQQPGNAERVVAEASPALAKVVASIKDDEVRHLLDSILLPRLGREPVGPLAGHLLEGIVEDGSHRGLVDIGVRELHDWALANEATITALLGQRAPWGSPK